MCFGGDFRDDGESSEMRDNPASTLLTPDIPSLDLCQQSGDASFPSVMNSGNTCKAVTGIMLSFKQPSNAPVMWLRLRFWETYHVTFVRRGRMEDSRVSTGRSA